MSRLIIDVREPAEYSSGHVEEAINIPVSQLRAGSQELRDVAKDTEIITYCRSGHRAGVAANILTSLGYSNVVNGINQQHIESSPS